MFEDKSFVVRPPKFLDPTQRICIEAIAFSIRATILALNAVKQIADSHDVRSKEHFPEADRVALYLHLWSVVDQTHMLRSLLSVLDPNLKSTRIKQFWDKYEVAYVLRNKMDHLKGELGNIANAKKPRPTTFGSLSYYVSSHPPLGSFTSPGGISVVVPLGTNSHEKHVFAVVSSRIRLSSGGVY